MTAKLPRSHVLFFITIVAFVLSILLNRTRLEFAAGFTTGLTIVFALTALYVFAHHNFNKSN